jgi:hypothetical protein
LSMALLKSMAASAALVAPSRTLRARACRAMASLPALVFLGPARRRVVVYTVGFLSLSCQKSGCSLAVHRAGSRRGPSARTTAPS